MRLSSLLLLSSIFSVSFCVTVQISSASGLISFSNNVNRGTDYVGTIVLLIADIDFSKAPEQFAPIGNSTSGNFRGIFDGQGHTISNLAVSSSAQFVGLFGYSGNITIQNVVIDGTCSFISSYSSGVPFIGSIIGYSPASKGPCMTTNIVNMANVTFKGETSTKLYIGGIIGGLHSSSYSSVIRNCVNYGTVTHSGMCKDNLVYIGGIAGYINRASSSPSLLLLLSSPSSSASSDYIQNCANYGTIIHSGASTGTLYIGGITGLGNNSSIENCVSSGVILTNQDDYIGTIIGHVSSTTTINHCYWTSDVGYSSVYGYKEPITTVLNVELASLDQSTVNELNEYAAEQDDTWNKWFMVHLNGGSINNITQESLVEIQGHFPDPVKEENVFLFWCKDAGCNEVFDPKTDSVSEITDIYAGWVINNYTVTFNFGNETTVNETFSYGSPIEYPAISEREGYIFNGWDNMPDNMPAKNITITAQWTPNNYTVTFDFGNGTTVNETSSYGSSIVYPLISEREGYTSNGWDNIPDNMPAENITITAQWTPNNYTVTFDLGNGTIINETFSYGSLIVYPAISEREGYTLSWDNYHESMPANNITITAQWTPNNYTVTFDFDNGTTVNETFSYGSVIDYPKNIIKEEYIFSGWDNYHEYMPAEDITVTVQWTEKTTSKTVEVVFSTKELGSDVIEEIIKRYTNEKFTIENVASDPETGGTRVIIKFTDEEKAVDFVRTVNENKRSDSFIKRITVIPETGDFSPTQTLSSFFFYFLLFLLSI